MTISIPAFLILILVNWALTLSSTPVSCKGAADNKDCQYIMIKSLLKPERLLPGLGFSKGKDNNQ